MPRLRSRRQRAARFESLESRQLLSANNLLGNVSDKSPIPDQLVNSPAETVAAQEAAELARFSLLDIGMFERGEQAIALATPGNDFQSMSLQASSLDVANDWQFIDARDYTADGVVDLLGQTPDGQFWLRMNDGQHLFEMPWGEDLLGETELISIADFTGDDVPDLLSYDPSSGKMWVSANSPDSGFRHELWTYFTPDAEWTNFYVGDFNGDGRNDVLATETGGGVWLAQNKETPGFKNHYWGRFPNFEWQDVVNGDFNGDGIQDLSARGPDDTWWIWSGSADGFDLATYWGHWKMASGWSDLRVADFNNDGRDDILGRTEDGALRVGSSSAHGLSTSKWGDGWRSDVGWSNITVVDINGDGLPDQLGRAKDDTWWYAKNVGGRFSNFFWQQQKGSEHFVVVKDFQQGSEVEMFAPAPVSAGAVSASAVNASAVNASAVNASAASASAASASAGVRVTLSEDNRIVLNGSGEKTFRIEVTSASGSLIPIPEFGSTRPMQFMLSNTPYRVELASLGMPLPIKGSVTLNVGWSPDAAANDLRVQYGVDELLDAVIEL